MATNFRPKTGRSAWRNIIRWRMSVANRSMQKSRKNACWMRKKSKNKPRLKKMKTKLSWTPLPSQSIKRNRRRLRSRITRQQTQQLGAIVRLQSKAKKRKKQLFLAVWLMYLQLAKGLKKAGMPPKKMSTMLNKKIILTKLMKMKRKEMKRKKREKAKEMKETKVLMNQKRMRRLQKTTKPQRMTKERNMTKKVKKTRIECQLS